MPNEVRTAGLETLTKLRFLIAGSALSLGLVAGQASAATTIFDDRSAFESAVPVSELVTFDSLAVGTDFAGGVDAGPFTLTASSSGFARIEPGPGFFAPNSSNFVQVDLFSPRTLTFLFDNPITAFGADFDAFNDEAPRTTLAFKGQTITPTVISGSNAQGTRFFGFTSTMSFSSLTVVGGGLAIHSVSIT